MARLDASQRAELPDRAFAYVDAKGRRRLPIHDEAHVRNALARFNQVRFEDEAARERARKRILQAARKFGIVPVGFITTQLQVERQRAQGARAPVVLPSGFLTMLMTDIEGSTGLVHRLGDGYRELIDGVRLCLREATIASGGHVVDARADEFFAVFECPRSALDTALAIQRDLRQRRWADGLEVRVRIGIHSGYPTLAEENYLGLAVHTAARVCGAAHGGQIVLTENAREAVWPQRPSDVRFRNLGAFRLRGLPEDVALYQVLAQGLASRFPAPRVGHGS